MSWNKKRGKQTIKNKFYTGTAVFPTQHKSSTRLSLFQHLQFPCSTIKILSSPSDSFLNQSFVTPNSSFPFQPHPQPSRPTALWIWSLLKNLYSVISAATYSSHHELIDRNPSNNLISSLSTPLQHPLRISPHNKVILLSPTTAMSESHHRKHVNSFTSACHNDLHHQQQSNCFIEPLLYPLHLLYMAILRDYDGSDSCVESSSEARIARFFPFGGPRLQSIERSADVPIVIIHPTWNTWNFWL